MPKANLNILLGPITHFGILVPLAFAGILATWTERSRLGIFYALLIAYSGSVALFYVFARYRSASQRR